MSTALHALLAGIVDYAGLFPPAALGMGEAVAKYAVHRASRERWMLGRFVLPAARLDEFAAAAAPHLRGLGDPWRLSALVGPDTDADLVRIAHFNAAHERAAQARGAASREGVHAVVDAVEAKAATPAGVERLAATLPGGLEAYVELPVSGDPEPMVAAVAGRRLRAKIRTGGVTSDLIPSAEVIARFMTACRDRKVPFKATAGLHHPVRAAYPLTYEPDAACATMHGFLNVFLAAALLHQGGPEAEAVRVLQDEQPPALQVTDDAIAWNGHRLSTAELAAARARFAISFGSCSFSEPVEELRGMGLI